MEIIINSTAVLYKGKEDAEWHIFGFFFIKSTGILSVNHDNELFFT
jgi:hypothetical protein